MKTTTQPALNIDLLSYYSLQRHCLLPYILRLPRAEVLIHSLPGAIGRPQV